MLDRRLRRKVKLRDLDTLVAVAQAGSMAKAAKVLSVSQPAISNAISDLEHVLGVQLFDRVSKGVEPTPYGRALLKWALAVFDDLRQGVGEIEFLADPTVGEVRIGASEPMQGGFIPTVIDRLTKNIRGYQSRCRLYLIGPHNCANCGRAVSICKSVVSCSRCMNMTYKPKFFSMTRRSLSPRPNIR